MGELDMSLYRQTLARRQQRYNASITTGEATPFICPWDTFFGLYLFFALVVAPRSSTRSSRIIRCSAFSLILLHSWYVVTHRRTLWFAGGYGLGLSIALEITMCSALLLFNDAGRDFYRLEMRPYEGKDTRPHINGSTATSNAPFNSSNIDLRKRKVSSVYTATDIKQSTFPGSDNPGTTPYRLVWQGYPHQAHWHHVIDWTVDLVTSFRGVNWNHRLPTLGPIDAPIPPKPKPGRADISSESPVHSGPTAIPRQTLRALQYRAVQDFLVSYLLLDFLKTIAITDPYLLGLEDLSSPSPWLWLLDLNEKLPFATRFVRLAMSMAGVISSLTFIFSLSPLFFATILPAAVDPINITKSPLLEPWLYPPQWYPLSSSIFETGLAGFWGKFWHQMFRLGISEPSRALVRELHLDPRGNTARIAKLLIAFGLSGSIHAAGSWMSFSLRPSYPLAGPLSFFILQALGIFSQTLAVRVLHGRVPATKSLPQIVRRTANAVTTVAFLYVTGPLLADDFARCGLWLFEPLPISIFRGFGFGPGGVGEGFWAWSQEGSNWIGWWTGRSWWETGVAIY